MDAFTSIEHVNALRYVILAEVPHCRHASKVYHSVP